MYWCGQCPLTMRARCSAFRYFPDPLGIVTAKQLDKLEFGGESPLTIRARYSGTRYCPSPLGIVTAEELDKLVFVAVLHNCFFMNSYSVGKGFPVLSSKSSLSNTDWSSRFFAL